MRYALSGVLLLLLLSCSRQDDLAPLPKGNYPLSGKLLINGDPYARLAEFCKQEDAPYFDPPRRNIYFWNLVREDKIPKIQAALELSDLPNGLCPEDTFYFNGTKWPGARAFFWVIPPKDLQSFRRAWGQQDSFPALFYESKAGHHRLWMKGALQSWHPGPMPGLGDTLVIEVDGWLHKRNPI